MGPCLFSSAACGLGLQLAMYANGSDFIPDLGKNKDSAQKKPQPRSPYVKAFCKIGSVVCVGVGLYILIPILLQTLSARIMFAVGAQLSLIVPYALGRYFETPESLIGKIIIIIPLLAIGFVGSTISFSYLPEITFVSQAGRIASVSIVALLYSMYGALTWLAGSETRKNAL